MDSFYMPDTQGVAYKIEHGKTTVAINRLDMDRRELDYFHNGGYFQLSGDDFDGLFQLNAPEGALPFLPYTEFAKLPETKPQEAHMRAEALAQGRAQWARRPAMNPIRVFGAEFAMRAEAVAERPFEFFHKYAFNTLRQVGANYELAGCYFDWLGEGADFESAADEARKISEVMKSAQFQLARAVTRRKFSALEGAVEPAAAAWDRLMESAAKALG